MDAADSFAHEGGVDDELEALLFDADSAQSAEVRARRSSVQPSVIAASLPPEPVGIAEFGEEAYCEAYPDIHAAISNGLLDSATSHFWRHGRQENRLNSPPYLEALIGAAAEFPATNVALSVDAVIISQSGTALIVGWLDDRVKPLRSLSVIRGNEGSNSRAIGRCRRSDVDALLTAPAGFAFGFWLVIKLEANEARSTNVIIRVRLADGSFEQREVQAGVSTDADLRDTIFGHFAALQYYGNRDIEAFTVLDRGLGKSLALFNRSISGSIVAAAHAEYYGPRRSRFKASLIVCLFGKIEYFFLQNALFANTIGIDEYEFIYVSNSPELAESLHKEAQIAERIYGLSITLVTLPGNGGFSAANNAAARFANSDRVIFVNPDVFPRSRDWALNHEALLERLPRERTALFGVPLYYDDGSLMHGGMYFEVDQGLSVKSSSIRSHGMLRVEHYGKGAPEWSDRYTRSRPVPAVTGAFISADREWFENLGGFTEDYVFGHYEDADLCLKSLRQGVPAWLHDLRFWHLEGKGSTRRPPHEGGSLLNRWLFTQRWGSTISEGLAGPSPTHKLLNVDGLAANGHTIPSDAASVPLGRAESVPEEPIVAAIPVISEIPTDAVTEPTPSGPGPGRKAASGTASRSRRAGRAATGDRNG
jgi:GT2 family glycosyltransferase